MPDMWAFNVARRTHGNDHQVPMTARVGRSNGNDTSAKVWSVFVPEAWRQDRALGELEGIHRGHPHLRTYRTLSSSLLKVPTFFYPRLVSLLLPWQRSSLATNNCPLIPTPLLSSFLQQISHQLSLFSASGTTVIGTWRPAASPRSRVRYPPSLVFFPHPDGDSLCSCSWPRRSFWED